MSCNLTELFYLGVVELAPSIFRYHSDPSKELCVEAIRKNPNVIRYISPNHENYRDLCLQAVQQKLNNILEYGLNHGRYQFCGGSRFPHICPSLVKFWQTIINPCPATTAFVINYDNGLYNQVEHTEELHNAMLLLNPELASIMTSHPMATCLEVVDRFPGLIAYTEQCPDLCERALRYGSACLFKYIKEPTIDLLVIALTQSKACKCGCIGTNPKEQIIEACKRAIAIDHRFLRLLTFSKHPTRNIKVNEEAYIEIMLLAAKTWSSEVVLEHVDNNIMRQKIREVYVQMNAPKSARKFATN